VRSEQVVNTPAVPHGEAVCPAVCCVDSNTEGYLIACFSVGEAYLTIISHPSIPRAVLCGDADPTLSVTEITI
jgi:hypothetical protein